MISDIFIKRPRLAAVVAIVIVIAGGLSLLGLPISQYPNVAPPQITVSATYPGANAEAVVQAIAQPLEEAVNGVESSIYMHSTATDTGDYSLNVLFDLNSDVNIDQVNVSNRVQLATAQLPASVSAQGVTVRKQSPNFLMAISFWTDDTTKLTPTQTGAYVASNVVPELSRITGVGSAATNGSTDYAMRIYTDPDKMAALDISTDDLATAIQKSNLIAALGRIGVPPAPDGQALAFSLSSTGRYTSADQFRKIVVRATPDGGIVRVGDVAKVELGALSYDVSALYSGDKPAFVVQIKQLPGANALNTVAAIRSEMKKLQESFPDALKSKIIYDSTDYVTKTIEEIVRSLFIIALIVVVIVYVFLQDWRATLIPALAIPVSIVGTFAFLLALGYSINVISLLALILAIGLVVDDAILVVENCQRVMEESGKSPTEAAMEAMREVTGPIVSTTLVLLAVFVPTTVLPGLSGLLYRQFGITLSIALVLSAITALTLTPALCAIFLRPPKKSWAPLRAFNKVFDKTRNGYGKVVGFLVRRVALALLVTGVAVALAAFSFIKLPGGLVPQEDQGAILFDVSLPNAASKQRTAEVMDQIAKIIGNTDGVADYITVAGFSLLQSAVRPSGGYGIITLKPWGSRKDLFTILDQLRQRFSQIPAATIVAFPPPAIPGVGSVGGFAFEVQARDNPDPAKLAQVTRSFIQALNKRPEIESARTTYSADVPSVFVEIDTDRAQILGLTPSDIYNTIGSAVGIRFVNRFNFSGRVYQVRLQAKQGDRMEAKDILDLYAKNSRGEMVPLRTVVKLRDTFSPYAIERFNLYASAEVRGNAASGYSSGQALQALIDVAKNKLPSGYTYAFSGLSYQQRQAGSVVYLAFALSFVFAYFFLVGLYESWLLPLSVMLTLSVAAAGAAGSLLLLGYALNIYSQIGVVMLIELASKNAILIVEFARDRRSDGLEITDAAITGARQRLRAVLMTALAFIIGIIPLAIASGAGAKARNAIGVTSIGGMLAATVVGIFLAPALYALAQRLREGRKGKLWGTEEREDDEPGGPSTSAVAYPWQKNARGTGSAQPAE